MDVVFYLHFINKRDDASSRSLSFYATNINTTWRQLHTHVAFSIANLRAQYGEIHQLISSPNKNVIGYMSLKINDMQTQEQIMQMWRAAVMQKIPGCAVGEVCNLMHATLSAEIFERTRHAHEQQHAEKLRTTLITHINAPAPTAATKKI